MRKHIKIAATSCLALVLASPLIAFADARDDAIAVAKSVAEEQLNVSETQIKFVQSQAREWSDSSLGCPQKGRSYMPAITAGHEIKLLTATDSHTIHVAGDNAVICGPAMGTPRTKQAARDTSAIELIKLARTDFAERLDVDESVIGIAGVTPTEWPDTGLGCPEKGIVYAQVVTPGFVIKLESGEQQAAYHTDTKRVVYCGQ